MDHPDQTGSARCRQSPPVGEIAGATSEPRAARVYGGVGGGTDDGSSKIDRDIDGVRAAFTLVPPASAPAAIGTPADSADKIEELFMTGAADGFAITPAALPTSLDDFAALVVPQNLALVRPSVIRLGVLA